MNARKFLDMFTTEELLDREVLTYYGEDVLLRQPSVGPLQELMREQFVTRLDGGSESRGWWFQDDGTYNNRLGDNVFTGQNEFINPHYRRQERDDLMQRLERIEAGVTRILGRIEES